MELDKQEKPSIFKGNDIYECVEFGAYPHINLDLGLLDVCAVCEPYLFMFCLFVYHWKSLQIHDLDLEKTLEDVMIISPKALEGNRRFVSVL